MLSAIDREDIDRIDDEEIQVIQDAWNYFPHRALGGKCPAEIMAEQLRRRRT
jgi:IS30 family transposase